MSYTISEEEKVLLQDLINKLKSENNYETGTKKFNNGLISSIKNSDGKDIFYKYINKNNVMRGFEYKTGLNIDTQKFDFDLKGICSPGLYFSNIESISNFTGYGSELWKVAVPEGLPILDFKNISNSNSIITDYYKAKSPSIYLVDSASKGTEKYANWLLNTNYANNAELLKSCQDLSNIQYYSNNMNIDINDVLFNKDIEYDCVFDTKQKKYLFVKAIFDNDFENDLTNPLINKNYDLLDESYYDTIFETKYKNKFYEKKLKSLKISDTADAFIVYKNNKFFKYLRNTYFPELTNHLKSKHLNLSVDIDFNNAKNLLEDYLKNSNIDYERLFTLLKEGNAIISGSLILSKLLNNKFKSNDIDIYINNLNPLRIHPIMDFFKIGAKTKNKSDSNIKIRINSIGEHTPYSMNPVDKIVNLTVYSKKNKIITEIQLIFINEEPFNFINKNFDFDFCKVAFDGDKFISNHWINVTNSSGSISEQYLDTCWNLKTRMSKYRIAKTIERVDKYMKRGFEIINYNSLLDLAIKKLEFNEEDSKSSI